jgi:hypothetical protein
MHRSETIEDCVKLVELMAFALNKAKIKTVEKVIQRIKDDSTKTVTIQALHKKLLKIREVEFRDFLAAWQLVTPETWAFYELMEYEGLREQGILADSITNLKEAWRKATNVKRHKKLEKKS